MKAICLFINLFILIAFSRCSDDEGALTNGSIVGFVRLVDADGNEMQGHGEVRVSLDNTSLSATSNEDGRYEIGDVPPGTYNLTFEKDSFSTRKEGQQQVIGGGIPILRQVNTPLYKIPSEEILKIDASYVSPRVEVSGEITPSKAFAIVMYISDEPSVSDTSYIDRQGTPFCCNETSEFSFDVYVYDNMEGKTLYMVAYLINVADAGSYPSRLKASEVISVAID